MAASYHSAEDLTYAHEFWMNDASDVTSSDAPHNFGFSFQSLPCPDTVFDNSLLPKFVDDVNSGSAVNAALTEQDSNIAAVSWNAITSSAPVDLSTCSVPFNQVLLREGNAPSTQQDAPVAQVRRCEQVPGVVPPLFVVNVPRQWRAPTAPRAATSAPPSHPKLTHNQQARNTAKNASVAKLVIPRLPLHRPTAPSLLPPTQPARKRPKTPTSGGRGSTGRGKPRLERNTFSCRRCRKQFAVNRILTRSFGTYEQTLPEMCIACTDASSVASCQLNTTSPGLL